VNTKNTKMNSPKKLPVPVIRRVNSDSNIARNRVQNLVHNKRVAVDTLSPHLQSLLTDDEGDASDLMLDNSRFVNSLDSAHISERDFMKCFDRRKGTLNSFELEKYLSEFKKQKEYEKGLRSCAEKVNLSPPIIESILDFFDSREDLLVADDSLCVIWFYYSERRMRWVRASLAINCENNKGIFCHRNAPLNVQNVEDEELKYEGPLDISDAKFIFAALLQARETMEQQIRDLTRKSARLRYAFQQDPIMKRCCGFKWSKWPMPPSIHQYLDEIMKLQDDLDDFEQCLSGFKYLLNRLLENITGENLSGNASYDWIRNNWKVPPDCKTDAQTDAKLSFEDLLRSTKAVDRHFELVEKRIERLIGNLRLKLDVEELFDQHSLTILATVMTVPTLIGGFWGMNIAVPWQSAEGNQMYFFCIVSICSILMVMMWLYLVSTSSQTRYSVSDPRKKFKKKRTRKQTPRKSRKKIQSQKLLSSVLSDPTSSLNMKFDAGSDIHDRYTRLDDEPAATPFLI